mgnify:FL=1
MNPVKPPSNAETLITLGLVLFVSCLVLLAFWKFGFLLGLALGSGGLAIFFILIGLVTAQRERRVNRTRQRAEDSIP